MTPLLYVLVFIALILFAYLSAWVAFRQGYIRTNPSNLKELIFGGGAVVGGYFGGAKKDEGNSIGMLFAKEKEYDSLKINGYGIVKKCKIKGDLEVNGAAEIKGCEVGGKTVINGHADIVHSNLKDISVNGIAHMLAGSANNIEVCGKFKAKDAAIESISYVGGSAKCPAGDNQPPFIRLKNTKVAKGVNVPSGVDKATAVHEE